MPVSVWNGNTSSPRRLRSRSSIGSMPSSSAAWSTSRSSSAVASGRPAPRYAPIGRRVGDGDGDVELDRRERVRAVRHPAGAARQERAERRVGAGVADEPHPQPGERAVAACSPSSTYWIWPRLCGSASMSSLRVGTHMTGRPARRAASGHHRVLGVHAGLAAEPAADLRGDDADVGRLHPERAGELSVQRVRHLRRRHRRESPVVADRGRAAVAAPSAPRPCAGSRSGRARRRRQSPTRSAARRSVMTIASLRSVLGEDHGRVVGERVLGIDDRRQRVDVGPHRRRPRPRPVRTSRRAPRRSASPTKRTRSTASGGRAKSSWTFAKPWCGATPRSAAVEHRDDTGHRRARRRCGSR